MLLLSISQLDHWKNGASDKVIEFQFTRRGAVKLDVSVYKVETLQQIHRVFAEHHANALNNPRAGEMLDVSSILPNAQQQDLDDMRFQFARSVHHNEDFDDEPALRVAVAKMVAVYPSKAVRIGKPDLRNYVQGRVQATDPEWVTQLQLDARWVKF